MFGLTRDAFQVSSATDLRLSFEGLPGLVVNVIRQDPLSGYVFCFSNRAKNRVKCFLWDGSGLWVCAKRIKRGTLAWPMHESTVAEMNGAQLCLPDDVATLQSQLCEQHAIVSALHAQLRIEKLGRERPS